MSTLEVTWNRRQSFPLLQVSSTFVGLRISFLGFYSPCPPILPGSSPSFSYRSIQQKTVCSAIDIMFSKYLPRSPPVLLSRAFPLQRVLLQTLCLNTTLFPATTHSCLRNCPAFISTASSEPFARMHWDMADLWQICEDSAQPARIVTVQHKQPGEKLYAESLEQPRHAGEVVSSKAEQKLQVSVYRVTPEAQNLVLAHKKKHKRSLWPTLKKWL